MLQLEAGRTEALQQEAATNRCGGAQEHNHVEAFEAMNAVASAKGHEVDGGRRFTQSLAPLHWAGEVKEEEQRADGERQGQCERVGEQSLHRFQLSKRPAPGAASGA